MNNGKKIILATILLFLISAVYLSWAEKKQADLNLNKKSGGIIFRSNPDSLLNFQFPDCRIVGQFPIDS